MKYVCSIQSIPSPNEFYTGIADDFEERLHGHNSGDSKHTAKFRPWRPVVVIRFEDEQKAQAFERYLKSGSGRAFVNRHFR
jgi:predicted GIY-YIG superfamily endonuclease